MLMTALAGVILIVISAWAWVASFAGDIAATVIMVGALGVAMLLIETPQYPRSTFGVRKWVAAPESRSIDICVNCSDTDVAGLSKQYGRHWVLLGVPVREQVDGEVTECAECSDADATEVQAETELNEMIANAQRV